MGNLSRVTAIFLICQHPQGCTSKRKELRGGVYLKRLTRMFGVAVFALKVAAMDFFNQKITFPLCAF